MTTTFCKCRYAHPIASAPQSQWANRIMQIPERCEHPDQCGEAGRGCREVCREYLRGMFIRAREVAKLKEQNKNLAKEL